MSVNPEGVVVYNGPSLLNRRPIVGIVRFDSKNQKTGDMAQLWILDRDVKPTEANKLGLDASVCGTCPLKGTPTLDPERGMISVGRSCYVNLGHGPRGIWERYQKGHFPVATARMLKEGLSGKVVRLGAFGDPAALPAHVIKRIVRYSTGHTGYTHNWGQYRFQWLKRFVMASCETPTDREVARTAGWRTFRARLASQPVLPGEILCPASEERGKTRQCVNCLACDGADRSGKVDVVIIGHGSRALASNMRKHILSLATTY